MGSSYKENIDIDGDLYIWNKKIFEPKNNLAYRDYNSARTIALIWL